MERAFKVLKDSKYYNRIIKYKEDLKKQKEVVKEFFKKNGIEAKEYYMQATGFWNESFKENKKKDINLYIVPTENDLKKLDKVLCKSHEDGLRRFKKGTKILKEFQQMCIDNNVVINIHDPKPRDYFKSLEYKSYRYSQRMINEELYLKIESPYLSEDEIPHGFEEIKMSQFYKVVESKAD